MDGILIINKPFGPTSHDIVDIVRKIIGVRKVGHAGTLDPFASGLLIILIGKATKLSEEFLRKDKTYLATIILGKESDTYDRTGKIKFVNNKKPTLLEIKKILKQFIGETNQIPPIYSAIKIKGKKLYEFARKGEKIKIPARKVIIYSIKLLKYKYPELEIEVKCGSGTYIRSLAADIGKKLKTGAFLKELERIQIGEFSIEKSVGLKDLSIKNIKKCLKPLA